MKNHTLSGGGEIQRERETVNELLVVWGNSRRTVRTKAKSTIIKVCVGSTLGSNLVENSANEEAINDTPGFGVESWL